MDVAGDSRVCQIQCVSWIFHHSDCLICDKDIIINVTLKYRVMARVKGWLIYVRVWEEDRSRYHIFSIVCCFCTVVNCSFITGTWWFVDLFPCSFFFCFLCLWPLQVSQRSGKSLEYQEKHRKIKKIRKKLAKLVEICLKIKDISGNSGNFILK